MQPNKTYLGDGVYAEFIPELGIKLSTEREEGEHEIFLDSDCLTNLNKFVESLTQNQTE
jgi:hypothetical protein